MDVVMRDVNVFKHEIPAFSYTSKKLIGYKRKELYYFSFFY